MQASFIITLELESEMIIPQTAEDLHDDLMESGHNVIKVAPWARPTLGLDTAASEAAFPTIGTEPPTIPMF